jgi:hypothetical protein
MEKSEDCYKNDEHGIQEILNEVNCLAGSFENNRINKYLYNDSASDW